MKLKFNAKTLEFNDQLQRKLKTIVSIYKHNKI